MREPVQNAIRFIEGAQHPEHGGWRYVPGEESDTSVSGWQLMALKSAQLAGVEVSAEVISRVSHWLETAQAADRVTETEMLEIQVTVVVIPMVVAPELVIMVATTAKVTALETAAAATAMVAVDKFKKGLRET